MILIKQLIAQTLLHHGETQALGLVPSILGHFLLLWLRQHLLHEVQLFHGHCLHDWHRGQLDRERPSHRGRV